MTITHEVAGNGPAVVLLHSSVCDRRMWDGQWDALRAAGYRVLRCDFRGFGETPCADRPYDNLTDLAELLDGLGIERAALVGSSFGGRLALQFAARHPDRVGSLTLLCPGSPDHEPSAELLALDDLEVGLVESGRLDEAVELMADTWLGPDADEAARAKLRVMQRNAYEVQLAPEQEISPTPVEVDLRAAVAPTLVYSGAHDLDDFRRIAADLAALLPDAEHRELPWAGHLPALERPAEVAELLLARLAEVGRR
ncbi:pimeloyl-ACP methyl ester carboxylesterase [Kitasatospora sp. SolWspMP-SS2h]|uniref:alpha/beta fold hydrolase n=1 Tax=Kitasatospora sp. SolWspMP-SS2h TaxID=1305729 RepID=UPI000DBA9CB6|nr:alpha/beta fold hydrolase [Kitasatospora sp. SolWspMP-SS2h]RAJ36874.1 pimeloyl-ACP methyl ester carboxylesterase [Kitasatospora sp. SolWspMP-SS2h]